MRVILVVLVAMVVGASQRAEACSCRNPPSLVTEAGVPLNARLPVMTGSTAASPAFALFDADGGVVPSSTVVLNGGSILIPTEPLAANAQFWLTGALETRGFLTGDRLDETPPGKPSLDAFTHSVSPLIGRSTCDLGGEGFLVSAGDFQPVDSLYFEVFMGPSPERIDTSSPAVVVPAAAQFFFGSSSLCSPVVDTTGASELAIQIRAVDGAGNASELSNALQLKSGGCSATGGSLALIALLVFFRRKPLNSRQ